MAEKLVSTREIITAENRKDLSAARDAGLSAAMLDRLTLNDAVIGAMADGLREVAALPDPVGAYPGMWKRPNGLLVGRVRIPLGVIGFIFESRPNVTVDAAALCLKAGNAVILERGLGGDSFQHDSGETAVGSPSGSGNSRKSRPGDPHHRKGGG